MALALAKNNSQKQTRQVFFNSQVSGRVTEYKCLHLNLDPRHSANILISKLSCPKNIYKKPFWGLVFYGGFWQR